MNKLENVFELTDVNFNTTIEKGITLVDFWAVWCMPCRMQGPILDSVAEKINGKAKIAKLNVDDYPVIAGNYGVMSIPTLILFKDGVPVRQFVGVQSEGTLLNAINSL